MTCAALFSHEKASGQRLYWTTPCSKWCVNINILNQFLETESTIQLFIQIVLLKIDDTFICCWQDQSEAFVFSKAILPRKFMTSFTGSCNQQLDVPDQNYCFCRDYSLVWVLLTPYTKDWKPAWDVASIAQFPLSFGGGGNLKPWMNGKLCAITTVAPFSFSSLVVVVYF